MKAIRPDHLDNIKKVKEKGSVICAGGLTNDDGKVIGSFLVMEFANKVLFKKSMWDNPSIYLKIFAKMILLFYKNERHSHKKRI